MRGCLIQLAKPLPIGIDFGTTNSCMACSTEAGTRAIVPNHLGDMTTPTVVAFTNQGVRLFGKDAKRAQIGHVRSTVHSCKRLLGRDGDQHDTPAYLHRITNTLTSTPGEVTVLANFRWAFAPRLSDALH
eukprot:gene9751-1755_t